MVAFLALEQDRRMIRISPATYYRAAATCVAAAVLAFSTHRASAQQSVDLLAGTLGVNNTPTTLSLGGVGANLASSVSGAFGPGFGGTVDIGVGALTNLSESFAPFGASNSFTIASTGVAAVRGDTSASKLYSSSLSPGATYALTLTRTAGFSRRPARQREHRTQRGRHVVRTTPRRVQGLLGSGHVDLLSIVRHEQRRGELPVHRAGDAACGHADSG